MIEKLKFLPRFLHEGEIPNYATSYDVLFSEPLMYHNTSEGDVLIIGYTSEARSATCRGTIVRNEPMSLLVKKITPKGTVRKGVYSWRFSNSGHKYSNIDCSIQADFWGLFPKLPEYKIWEKHLLDIAKQVVSEYSGYGWSYNDIPRIVKLRMESNPHFDTLYHASKEQQHNYCNRISTQHNVDSSNLLQSLVSLQTEDLCKLGFLSGDTESTKKEKIEYLRVKKQQLNDAIYGNGRQAHRYEDFSSEISQYKCVERELYTLVKKGK